MRRAGGESLSFFLVPNAYSRLAVTDMPYGFKSRKVSRECARFALLHSEQHGTLLCGTYLFRFFIRETGTT